MKFTKRKNGEHMATFQIRYHVPKQMYDFIFLNSALNHRQTEEWIVTHIDELRDDWRGLVIEDPHSDDAQPSSLHVDEIGDVVERDGEDAFLRYDGPEIIASRR